MINRAVSFCLCISAGWFVSCASAGQSVYMNPNTITDSDTGYSDTDLRSIAASMVNSLLSSPRVYEKGDRPTVMLGKLENKTTQHIDMGAILNKIETQMINSGKVRFVNRKVLSEMAKEQALIQTMGDESVETGALIGSQYRLDGEMTEIPTKSGHKKVRFYRIGMWLTDNATSEKIWASEKEFKKAK